jgi:histidinol phosphatase-like enzyme
MSITDMFIVRNRWRGLPARIERCALNELGYLVVVVTNQAGVAHGYYSEESVHALHRWMREELAANGAVIDAFYHVRSIPRRGWIAFVRITSIASPVQAWC